MSFEDELMAKAEEIKEAAVRKRAKEIDINVNEVMPEGEEVMLYGTRTRERVIPPIKPGSPEWSAIESWYDWIPGVFDPWTRLPDPKGFDPLADSLDGVMRTFGAESDGELTRHGLESTLIDYIDNVNDHVNDWYGDAATSFRHFAKPLEKASRNQFALADVLKKSILANKQIFVKSRKDILNLAEHTKIALQGGGPWGGDELTLALTVVSAVASVAATAASGGATLPLAIAAVGGAASVGAAAAGADEKKELPIGGHTVDQVLNSMVEAVVELKRLVSEEEDKLAVSLVTNQQVVIAGWKDIVAPRPRLADLRTDSDIRAQMKPPG